MPGMRSAKTVPLRHSSLVYYYYYIYCGYCFYYLYYLYYYLSFAPTTAHLSNMPPTDNWSSTLPNTPITTNSWCLLSVQPTTARRPNLSANN